MLDFRALDIERNLENMWGDHNWCTDHNCELRANRRQNNLQTATRRQNSSTIDECMCFSFVKYCEEMPGESVTSYLLMNIKKLAMAVSSVI